MRQVFELVKLLSVGGNFINCDVNRLYLPSKEAGWVLKSVLRSFELWNKI